VLRSFARWLCCDAHRVLRRALRTFGFGKRRAPSGSSESIATTRSASPWGFHGSAVFHGLGQVLSVPAPLLALTRAPSNASQGTAAPFHEVEGRLREALGPRPLSDSEEFEREPSRRVIARSTARRRGRAKVAVILTPVSNP
jgi:hypothetical protein